MVFRGFWYENFRFFFFLGFRINVAEIEEVGHLVNENWISKEKEKKYHLKQWKKKNIEKIKNFNWITLWTCVGLRILGVMCELTRVSLPINGTDTYRTLCWEVITGVTAGKHCWITYWNSTTIETGVLFRWSSVSPHGI